MLREAFLGRYPSHFHINRVVKAYILSEAILWSAWQFIVPLFAVFVTTSIPGATIQTAGAAISLYLVFRVVSELIAGRFLLHATDRKKLLITLKGLALLSIGYILLGVTHDLNLVLVSQIILGIGIGIASPAKNSLFSMHIDKSKEAAEWGIADGVALICMAFATALGGFVAEQYGFSILFLLASVVNTLAMIPYLVILF